MPTTQYTSGIRCTQQPTGGNASTWGTITDDNIGFIDDALTGWLSVDMTGAASKELTVGNGTADEARMATLYIHGTPSSATSIFIPTVQKSYRVIAEHTSISGGITVKTSTGEGVAFFNGDRATIDCDGTSVYTIGSPTSDDVLLGTNNLSDVDTVSTARANLGVNPEGTYIQSSGSALELNLAQITSAVASAGTSAISNNIFPVGATYITTNNVNPGTYLTGTWTQIGQGRALVGVGTGTDINGVSVTYTSGQTGGEYVHTQTTAELVPHTHAGTLQSGLQAATGTGRLTNDSGNLTGSTGGGQAFNIQQPYLAVYFWERTA